MKSLKFVSAIIMLILLSASASAYIGECPAGMLTRSACGDTDHCVERPTMNTAVADSQTGLCRLKLSEIWRDTAAETEDAVQIGILPASPPEYAKSAFQYSPLVIQNRFDHILEYLDSVFLLL
ncbi:MAG: hypothetical protein HN368_11865 [Spirochaetales bacterium]|jgi:hypothetical protein|nr:hypothetical protein [Spirochaetales bacterium]